MKVNYKYKNYTHFDCKKAHQKYSKYIADPKWIEQHGFYPFVHFEIKSDKYGHYESEEYKKIKEKTRHIMKSAHIDRYIYQYYGEMLNINYNLSCCKLGIDKVSLAYRNNKPGKSNIHFAKDAIERIHSIDNVLIYVADFTNFFDKLDHHYLLKMVKKCLNTSHLSNDWFKVLKSITRYAYVEQSDIEKVKGLKTHKLSELEKFFSTKEFRNFKKDFLNTNKETFGIPQGSSISAVLSNVYLIEFDKKLNDFSTTHGGIYRRYCDDILIALPVVNEFEDTKYLITETITKVKTEVPNLIINDDKTEYLVKVKNERIKKYGGNEKSLDYLGFSYNGLSVSLREKSLFKYYSRLHRKLKVYHYYKENPLKEYAIRNSIYYKFSHLGNPKYATKRKRGNFITYAVKAHKEFNKSKVLESRIRNQYKRHWNKINQGLKSK